MLCDAALPECPPEVAGPAYDRSSLGRGVVHIGVGGFHRAHQAMYFDELARRGLATGWGITGVGLHHADVGHALWPQDCLYTLVERGQDAARARVIGVMTEFLHAPTRSNDVLDALSDARTRLVTLTVTGDAYNIDADGQFDSTHPDVAGDLEAPTAPRTVYGYIVEALDRRRRACRAPFTVLSCDNVPHNGQAARTMVLSFARLRDPSLADWIERHVSFPSSVVDRITPTTTASDRDRIATEFGVADRWPVITEPFSQWVVEDDFCNGRPPLEVAGVQFVRDVTGYELTKKRLLNGSHCALGYLGTLAGHATAADVMSDDVLNGFVSGFLDEVSPLLPTLHGLDLDDHKSTVMTRLSNPSMSDQLDRLCRRGSTKMPSYLVPTVIEAVESGRPHRLLTLALAGWFRYLRGLDDHGRRIVVEDARADELTSLARAGGTDPRPLLCQRDLFGDLVDHEEFVELLTETLEQLERGVHHAARGFLTATSRA
jgi:mannitol 2-dehydrogenase